MGLWLTGVLAATGWFGVSAAGGLDAQNGRDSLHGTWTVVSSEVDGKPVQERPSFGWPLGLVMHTAWIIQSDNGFIEHEATCYGFPPAGQLETHKRQLLFTYKLDPSKQPPQMDLVVSDPDHARRKQLLRAIYQLQGDSLKLCYSHLARPQTFATQPKSKTVLFILKRKKQ